MRLVRISSRRTSTGGTYGIGGCRISLQGGKLSIELNLVPTLRLPFASRRLKTRPENPGLNFRSPSRVAILVSPSRFAKIDRHSFPEWNGIIFGDLTGLFRMKRGRDAAPRRTRLIRPSRKYRDNIVEEDFAFEWPTRETDNAVEITLGERRTSAINADN